MDITSEAKTLFEEMNQKIQIVPSGISLIDKAWGGLYRGGTYLLVGAHKSGRTTLAIEFVKECVEQKEICLYFTIRRPKDLMMHAASLNFDLQDYVMQNSVIVVRVDSAISLDEKRSSDEILSDYIRDIVGIVEQYQPSKIIFDELTPFLNFKNIELLEKAFSETIEAVEDFGITTIFILGDPITASAKKVVDVLASHSTGIFYLQRKEYGEEKLPAGLMSITPVIGHTEGKFKAGYTIVPHKGFSFITEDRTTSRFYSNGKSVQVESKYKPINEIATTDEEYQISNLYNYDDFKLIINSLIALYKSTGLPFTLVSFRLDEEVIKNNLISLNQLRNAIRLSVERKDKICVVANKVIVLIPKEDQKDVSGLISRVKGNLTFENNGVKENITKHISVYALRIDDSVNSCEDMLNEIRSDEVKGSSRSNLI